MNQYPTSLWWIFWKQIRAGSREIETGYNSNSLLLKKDIKHEWLSTLNLTKI